MRHLVWATAGVCWAAALRRSGVSAWSAALPLRSTTSSATALLSTTLPQQQQPPRVVVAGHLPVVYVYDHCPFCVRVRFALGYKNVKHALHFLANDDVATPTALVGKKVAPIFTHDTVVMPESLDIIKYVDSNAVFGPVNAILPGTDRTDLKAWQKSVQDLLRTLQRPRYVQTGLLPEFQMRDARQAFVRNHPLPPYEKADWKSNMTWEQQARLYQEYMQQDATARCAELNAKLVELNDLVYSEYYCSNVGGISYDDVDLWSRLRSITIIKNVEWPAKLRRYMDNLSELVDVPLYDAMAL
jgi:glutaredoxin 2